MRTLSSRSFSRHIASQLNSCSASPAQRAYMLAKAAYQTARAAADKEIAALGPEPTDDQILAEAGITNREEDPRIVHVLGRARYGVDRSVPHKDRQYNPEFQHSWFRAKDAIEERCKTSTYQTLLWKAEDVLVEWAREESKRVYGVRYASIAQVFDAWPLYGDMRERLVDMCFRMPAGPGGAR